MSRHGAARFRSLHLVLGFAVLAWLLLLAKPVRLLGTFRDSDPVFAVAAAVPFVGVLLLEAVRIELLFQPYDWSFRTALRVTMASMFFGSFTPGALGGEAYKVSFAQERVPGLARPIALVLVLRLAGLGATLALAALYGVTYPGRILGAGDLLQARWYGPSPGALGLAAVLLAAGLGLALASPWGRALGRPAWPALVEAGRALRLIRPARITGLALVSLLIAAARILYLDLLARSFAPALFLPDLALVAAAATIAGAVPVTLGGLGTQEGALAAGLILFGLPYPDAIAASLLNRGFLWAAAAAGWVSLVRSRPGRGEPAC